MNKELKHQIQLDLARIYDHPITIKERLLLPLEIKHLILWRKASFYRHRYLEKGGILAHIPSFYYGLRLIHMSNQTQIAIPAEAKIGNGLYIGHLGRIIIHPEAVLGNNINLSTGITIGQANRGPKKGVPTIGNNVWIGTNAVIVGNITIGDDVMIAPNSFVNMDIPAHSVVIGNPATIHPRDNATQGYLNHLV